MRSVITPLITIVRNTADDYDNVLEIPDLEFGYVQGMNQLLGPFMYIMTEV